MARNDRTLRFDAAKIVVAALVLPAMLGGCTAIRDRRGYVQDSVLTNAITPGIDNRESVTGTLGQPSFASQFGAPTWYYVSSTTEQRVFGQPKIEAHEVLKVSFDGAGNVTAVSKAGMDDVRDINPDGDKTPTLGRDRGFFQDLFGNIGAVGAAGAGGGPGGPGPGGGPNGS